MASLYLWIFLFSLLKHSWESVLFYQTRSLVWAHLSPYIPGQGKGAQTCYSQSDDPEEKTLESTWRSITNWSVWPIFTLLVRLPRADVWLVMLDVFAIWDFSSKHRCKHFRYPQTVWAKTTQLKLEALWDSWSLSLCTGLTNMVVFIISFRSLQGKYIVIYQWFV